MVRESVDIDAPIKIGGLEAYGVFLRHRGDNKVLVDVEARGVDVVVGRRARQ